MRPFNVAVVGGGPAGFYAASRLLAHQSQSFRVHMYELLPVPFGLVRFGVAPDHPEVKNCEHKFFQTAQDPRFRFLGNVHVGGGRELARPYPHTVPLPLAKLRTNYDAVLLSYGASLDRFLNIPGESSLSNVMSARSFVNWYNGHPLAVQGSSEIGRKLIDLSKSEHVTVVGQGNVALDVARILLKPIDSLLQTDIPEEVIETLKQSKVQKVEVVGRRGILQMASTTKELREMMNLPFTSFDTDLEGLKEAKKVLEANPKMENFRMRKRILELVEKGSKVKAGDAKSSWSLRFLRSPVALFGDEPSSSSPSLSSSPSPSPSPSSSPSLATSPGTIPKQHPVREIEWEINQLETTNNASSDPVSYRAVSTGEKIRQRTDMVLRSVGYKSLAIPGLPFDERRAVVSNESGTVVDEARRKIPGLYVTGWLSRGPTGVIATTMYDAYDTADLMIKDLLSSSPPSSDSSDSSSSVSSSSSPSIFSSSSSPPGVEGNADRIADETLKAGAVSWDEWLAIDAEERRRGESKGKVKEKITDLKEMLSVIRR